jgi:hypothetical protein
MGSIAANRAVSDARAAEPYRAAEVAQQQAVIGTLGAALSDQLSRPVPAPIIRMEATRAPICTDGPGIAVSAALAGVRRSAATLTAAAGDVRAGTASPARGR